MTKEREGIINKLKALKAGYDYLEFTVEPRVLQEAIDAITKLPPAREDDTTAKSAAVAVAEGGKDQPKEDSDAKPE